MKDHPSLSAIASQIRRDIVRMVHAQNSGHPGGSLGCTDLFTALYFEILDYQPTNFTYEGENEDMFFLSNGHISPVWYATLARAGFFPIDELSTFRMIHSRLQGHPTPEENLPGVRVASGSLGQGLSVAIGAALNKRLCNDPKWVFCLTGDGELQEGQIWEAALFAAHHQVDNLITIVDYNKKQIDGSTDDVISLGNLAQKWEAFGWKVFEMNGHDFDQIQKTIQRAKEERGKGKPSVILMHTEMGQGVDFMMGSHAWHGIAPNNEQLAQALAQLEETLGDFNYPDKK